jgi:hypothetical protein
MDQTHFSLVKSRQDFYLRFCLTFTVIVLTVVIFCLFKLFILILSST